MNIAKSIQRYMYLKRLNQGQLADVSGLTHATLSRIKHGYIPSLETVVKLADGCNVKVSTFIAAGEK